MSGCVHENYTGRVLYGGDGPDDAAEAITCNICGAHGWKWCGGDVTWRRVMTREEEEIEQYREDMYREFWAAVERHVNHTITKERRLAIIAELSDIMANYKDHLLLNKFDIRVLQHRVDKMRLYIVDAREKGGLLLERAYAHGYIDPDRNLS